MTDIVIKGGTVVDRDGERVADIAIEAGCIVAVGADLEVPRGSQVLDAAGCIVSTALVDLHTHLRQPGREDAETIETASRAAVLGGYAYLVAMPNTDPAMDCVEVIDWVNTTAAQEALCAVLPSAAITVGRHGEALAPMAELAEAGVTLFTDDGNGVQDDRLMRRAMEYASSLRPTHPVGPITLAQHCELDSLAAGGCMHEGEWSARLGLPGIPAEAEELMVTRDLALARMTGCRIHFQHLSTAGSVELVRAAKAAGLAVTAEATTHHFTLTHAELAGYDPLFKVNPPLRTQADVEAIKVGLADGTIDAIATDHAPHTQDAKELPLDQAPAGHARAGDRPGPGPDRAGPAHRAGAGPHVLAAGGDLRRSGQSCRRPDPAGRAKGRIRPTCASSTPEPPGPSIRPGWPAAVATRPMPGGP